MTAERFPRRYIIWAPPFAASAGIRVLYMLYEKLRARGCEAYIFCPEEHQDCFEYLDFFDAETLERDIVVYPDIVWGNPLRFRRVARFALYYPGVLHGEAVYHPDELVFTWRSAYTDAPLLCWSIVDKALFRDEGLPKTQNCWFINKGKKRDIPEIRDAVAITMAWPESRAELAQLLKTTDTLYSFDPHSSLLFEAALCGAKVVLVTDTGLEEQAPPSFEDVTSLEQCVLYGQPLPYADEEAAAMLERFIAATQNMPASGTLQEEEAFFSKVVPTFYAASVRAAAAGVWEQALDFCRKAWLGKPLPKPSLQAMQERGAEGDRPDAVARFLRLTAFGCHAEAEAILLPSLAQSVSRGDGPAASMFFFLLALGYEQAGRNDLHFEAGELALLAEPLNVLALHLHADTLLAKGSINQALHHVCALLGPSLKPLNIADAGYALALMGMIINAAPEKQIRIAERLARDMPQRYNSPPQRADWRVKASEFLSSGGKLGAVKP